MRAPRLLAGALALAAVSCADACGNECSFGERCRGDVLEVCGYPDQFFNREILAMPCTEPAAACVETRTGPSCVVAPPTPCEVGYHDRCEGDVRYYCPAVHAVEPSDAPPDYVSAQDCAAIGATCVVDPDDGVVCRAKLHSR